MSVELQELQEFQEERDRLHMALEEMAWLVAQKDQLLKQLEDTMAAAAAQDSPEHAKQMAAMQRELQDMKMRDHKQQSTILALVWMINETETDPAEAASPETWLF